ncbi:5563_t:CDS:2, partial [Dentiscutata heterogama]
MAPSHRFLTDLSDDMAELLNTGAGYDVVIHVGEEPNVKEFRTHSVMLAARCPYFQTALSSKWAKKQGDIFVFRKPNISPRTFNEILLYLYSGTIDLVQQDGIDLIKIIVAADELGLQKIVEVIKQYLIDNQSELLIRNPIRNPAKNLLQWTDKDFIALRESLNDLIPLIRWIHISSSDFLYKVRPFKKLLPQTLYEEILSYHLDSGNKPTSLEILPRKGPIFDSNPHLSENSASSPNNNSTSGGSWWKTSSSFLFSFNDLDFKIARVERPQYAIYYDRKYGPGWGYSGDLIIKDSGSIYNSQKSMTYPDASKFFPYTTSSEYDIDEYEVFQVVRKPGFKKKNRARYYSREIVRTLKRQNWNYFFKVLIMIMFTLFIGWMIIKYEIHWK